MTKQRKVVLKFLLKQCKYSEHSHIIPDKLNKCKIKDEKLISSLIYLQQNECIKFKYNSCHDNDLHLGIDVTILEKGYNFQKSQFLLLIKVVAWIITVMISILGVIVAAHY